MQFDLGTVLIAAMLVIVPGIFAAVCVKRQVSRFIRDVEREEQEKDASGKEK